LRNDSAMLAPHRGGRRTARRYFRAGGKVYSCGNGGSMCDAMHVAEELSGRFRDIAGYAALAISDPALVMCRQRLWLRSGIRALVGRMRARRMFCSRSRPAQQQERGGGGASGHANSGRA